MLGRYQPAPAAAQHRLHGRWGSWQQQQAAREALDQALTMPTLSYRPLLIASLLQPLFASLSRQLAGKAGTVSAIRAAGVSNPLRRITIGGLADEVNGAEAKSGAAGGIISVVEPSVADWQAVQGPVLQQLRAVVGMDSEWGINRALAHGLLFQCWSEVMAIEEIDHSCEDSLEPWRDCQISTGVIPHPLQALLQHTYWVVNISGSLVEIPPSCACLYRLCNNSTIHSMYAMRLL